MSREWKPGDVAMVTWKCLGAIRTEIRLRGFTASGAGTWWDGYGTWIGDSTAKEVRPLVVIDPEDREQVSILARELGRLLGDIVTTNDMQAALREFANPTPPRPDEPTGLGAVVEDDKGEPWVRTLDDYHPWVKANRPSNSYTHRTTWDGITAVRVLSEGIPA